MFIGFTVCKWQLLKADTVILVEKQMYIAKKKGGQICKFMIARHGAQYIFFIDVWNQFVQNLSASVNVPCLIGILLPLCITVILVEKQMYIAKKKKKKKGGQIWKFMIARHGAQYIFFIDVWNQFVQNLNASVNVPCLIEIRYLCALWDAT